MTCALCDNVCVIDIKYMPILFISVILFSPQSSLTKFAESLQEMINYHTVCIHCHTAM